MGGQVTTRIDDSVVRAILEKMILTRAVEERISERYGEQEMRCPTHLCIGQEAIAATASIFLNDDDLVFSGHRSHGHYIAKGGDINAMIAELYGRATGCAAGKGGSQHLIDLECGFMGAAPILASTISVAVGAAWAAQLDKKDIVVITYFGDGATEEGAFHESLNFASVHKLPIVFICENNLYSVHSAMDIRQPEGRPIAAFGPANGMPSLTCDGNDVTALYPVFEDAIGRARSGDGPSLVECMTYRWLEHCGPGDDSGLGYRPVGEIKDWQKQDPIPRFVAELKDQISLNDVAHMKTVAEAATDAAFEFAVQSPYPDAGELDRHIYPQSSANV